MSERETFTNLFGEVENKCLCDLCEYSRKIREIVARKNAEELIETIHELHEATYNMGADLDYLKCIMDGSWPSAEQQLTLALEKARNHPNRELERAERPWIRK